MNRRLMRIGCLLLVVTGALAGAGAFAQAFPNRPLRVIVPYPPGGGTDVLARVASQKLGERLGQTVVVENRTGASGNIGTELVIRAPADGYTLLFNNETLAVGPNVSKNVPYDVMRDLAPVGLVASSDLVIGVHPSVAAKSVGELLAVARAQPGKLSYSSCGNGTIMHLAGELLKQSASVDLAHVAYRGCGPAIQDSASGQVPVFVNTLPNVAPLEKQGRVRMLAITSAKRSSHAPELPTVAESGIAGYEATSWYGYFAPAATPREVVSRLSGALAEAVSSPEVRDRVRGMLYEPRVTTPEELSSMLRAELARWSRVAKSARIEID